MQGAIITTETDEKIEIRTFTLVFCSVDEDEKEFIEWIDNKSQLHESTPEQIIKDILKFNTGMCNIIHELDDDDVLKS